MNKTPVLPADMEKTLRRYMEIQHEEQELKDEKTDLQKKIGEYMAGLEMNYWYPEIDGQALKVRYRETSIIEYDESRLRSRLGDRYAAILAPDLRKIRVHLDQLESLFSPILNLVGTPAPEKVRVAIETGVVNKDEFTGAFKKSVRRYVAVGKARAGDLHDIADAEKENTKTY